MKARILKLRTHFPYGEGQIFVNVDGHFRTLRKLHDNNKWGFADDIGKIYLVKNNEEDMLFYIKTNHLTVCNPYK